MTKKEAIDFIKSSEANGFRYGDLSYITPKDEAIHDIISMEELAWNDGDIYGAILIIPVSKEEYLEWYNRCVKEMYQSDEFNEDEIYEEYVADCEGEDIHELRGIITKTGNPVTF